MHSTVRFMRHNMWYATARRGDLFSNLLVVDSGPIVEQGQHQESVEKGGLYSRIKQTHIAAQGWGLAM